MPDYAHELAESFINGRITYVIETILGDYGSDPTLVLEVYRTLENYDQASAKLFRRQLHEIHDRRMNDV